MTLATTITKVSYSGDGTTTAFAVSFPFVKDADVHAVLVTDGVEAALTLGTDYTLSGAGTSTGGTLTMTTAPASGKKLTIYRSPAIVQETDYVENSAFPAETLEDALDLLTMIAQGLQEQIDRSIKVPISSTVDPDSVIAQLEEDAATASNAASTATAQAQTAATQAQVAAESATAAAESAVEAQGYVGDVRASATDTTPAPLVAKLQAGEGMAFALQNSGADESLVAAVDQRIISAARILNHAINGGF